MKSDKQKLKDKAWTLFSQYIRRKYADENGYVTCVTCGETRHWKDDMQAGHFINSRNNTVLFDERLVYPQCKSCNYYKGGEKISYTLFMLKNGYTKGEIEHFLTLKHKTKKMSISDYQDLIDKYTDLNVGLDMRDE